MVLVTKTGWLGIAFTLLTTGMSVQYFPRSAAGSDSNREGVAAVHQNEIKKAQETLRNTGHHRGEVDGILGLRTRAVRPVDRDETGYETTKGKPSACIKWANGSGRKGKTPRKIVKTVAAPESGRAGDEKTLRAENDHLPR